MVEKHVLLETQKINNLYNQRNAIIVLYLAPQETTVLQM